MADESMPCPRCERSHARGEYVERPDLEQIDGIPYCPPDVRCPCGALLRYSVPIFATGTHGWVWRVVN